MVASTPDLGAGLCLCMWFSMCGPQLASPASCGCLLEMQHLRPFLESTESECVFYQDPQLI